MQGGFVRLHPRTYPVLAVGMLMVLAVPVVLAQALPVANLSGQPLRSGRFGVYVHSGATCGDTHVQLSGAGQWLESVRYGFLKKQGGTW